MPNPIDITDQRFGRLTAIARVPGVRLFSSCAWTFQCDCGKVVISSVNRVRSGNTKSCGCWNIEVSTSHVQTHGLSNTPEWEVWKTMKQRCHNPKSKRYPEWGGRGIVVCEQWRKSFEVFISDIGNRPSSQHQIERINNNGNYEPGNVKWATRSEQARNKRNNRLFDANGMSMTIPAWSEMFGVKQGVIANRLYRLGWSVEDAVKTPSQIRRKCSA